MQVCCPIELGTVVVVNSSGGVVKVHGWTALMDGDDEQHGQQHDGVVSLIELGFVICRLVTLLILELKGADRR
ncbi:hypothetical protein M0R45_015051 [Rubus argutus]|uniref:Uncharacterized protein n=1 Tax=Rubus argutus TaxID=59490 RepID=A0AAW1VMR6_RUBAR